MLYPKTPKTLKGSKTKCKIVLSGRANRPSRGKSDRVSVYKEYPFSAIGYEQAVRAATNASKKAGLGPQLHVQAVCGGIGRARPGGQPRIVPGGTIHLLACHEGTCHPGKNYKPAKSVRADRAREKRQVGYTDTPSHRASIAGVKRKKAK